MNLLCPVALVFWSFCSVVAAPHDEMHVGIGRGIICDSADQLQRFVELRNIGQDTEAAIQRVNDEVQNPIACGIVVAQFSFEKSVRKLRMLGEPVSIVEITVTAMNDGNDWNDVPPTTQYTLVVEAGEDL